MNINWDEIHWEEWFGTIWNTKSLKGPQYNFMKSDIVERAFEKYSNRQLEYVGDICNGKDFDAIDSLNYEMKCLDGLIQKTTYNTKKITLKNFHTNNTGMASKTFDKMIAVDTKQNTVLLCDWENIEMKMNDATITCVLHEKKCQTLISRETPLQKPINFKENYATFIESII